MIPLGFGQVNFRLGGNGLPNGGEVTVGFQNQSDLDTDFIASFFGGAWNDNLDAVLPTNVTLLTILAKLGPDATGPFSEVAANSVGNRAAGEVNPQMALLVQKRTALGGRANRGRLFFPVGESDVENGGLISTSLITAASTAFTGFFDDTAGGALPLYVLHKNSPPVPTIITSLAPQSRSATQRRRNRR